MLCEYRRKIFEEGNALCLSYCLSFKFLILMQFPGYGSYASNLRPLLTEANQAKQVIFSNRVHARWGLPADKKILWTMSDEKWWHGMVTRTFAKMCPELGVERSSFAVHHLLYIIKVIYVKSWDTQRWAYVSLFHQSWDVLGLL